MFRLFRQRERAPAALAPFSLGVLLVALFAVPDARGYDALFDLACVFLVLPAVVWIGARDAGRRGAAISKALGDLSYPLYVVQIPVLMWCQGVAQAVALDDRIPPKLFALMELGVALAAAWVMLKLFDEPARRWLSRRLLTGRAPGVPGRAAAQQS
jgi:peptidoglycan/LPS O-acetylase OafA/YrhL